MSYWILYSNPRYSRYPFDKRMQKALTDPSKLRLLYMVDRDDEVRQGDRALVRLKRKTGLVVVALATFLSNPSERTDEGDPDSVGSVLPHRALRVEIEVTDNLIADPVDLDAAVLAGVRDVALTTARNGCSAPLSERDFKIVEGLVRGKKLRKGGGAMGLELPEGTKVGSILEIEWASGMVGRENVEDRHHECRVVEIWDDEKIVVSYEPDREAVKRGVMREPRIIIDLKTGLDHKGRKVLDIRSLTRATRK